MEFDFKQIPYWLMAICCVYTVYSLKKRDDVIDSIVKIIYGSDQQRGMESRLSVVESTIDRCPECTPSGAVQAHSRWCDHGTTHMHLRKNGSLDYSKGTAHNEV